MPDALEEIDPAFEHVGEAALPIVEAKRRAGADRDGVVMGRDSADDRAGRARSMPISCCNPVPRYRSTPPRTSGRCIWSTARATLEGVPLTAMTLYVLRPGIAATLRSASGGRAMLCGGDAFATPRHVWWNFVSSRRDRIAEAKRAWMAGDFPRVPGDMHEWIPIPDVPKTVSYP